MFQSIIDHIAKLRQWYIWMPMLLAFPFVLGKVDVFLNHGKPLPDYSSAIYSYSLEAIPVWLSFIFAAIWSSYLSNSLTTPQYVLATWKDKLVDNQPEIIIFLATLIHFHLHS